MLPKLREPVQELLHAIDMKAAKEGRKEALWTDEDKFPEILALSLVSPKLTVASMILHLSKSIQVTESELIDELRKS